MCWLQVILILLTASASSAVVIFVKNVDLEKLLQTCILYVFSIKYYDWIVSGVEWMDLHTFGIFLYFCVYPSVASVLLDFVFISVLRSLSIRGWCPLNMNILMPKIPALQVGPEKQNGQFLGNGSNDFD
jgi:hypothetical protein